MALQLIRSAAKLNPLVRYSHHASHRFSDAIRGYPIADVTELDNGIKVATEKTNSPLVSVGVWIEGGSRHGPKELNGITNFIEQILFKGTKNRPRKQLEKDIYGLGATLNSFNDRENIGLYSTLSTSDVSKAIEVLGDVVQNPALNAEDIEEARSNILKELEDCQSNYEQIVFDYLHSVAYQGTSLAFSKYGPTENIKAFSRSDIEKGLDLIFKGPRIVVAASGNVDHSQIVKLVQQNFKQVTYTYDKVDIPDHPSSRFTGSDIRVRDDSMPAAHIAIAVEGPGYDNPDFIPMEIASSLFSKWDLTQGGSIITPNNRLDTKWFQSIQPFNLAYRNTALWGTFFVGDRMKLEGGLHGLLFEWRHFCTKITNNEIQKGKNVLLSKLISQREGSINNVNSLALDVLRYGRRVTLEEWEEKINQVDKHKIHKVAEHYIWDRDPAVSAIGPVEQLEGPEWIKMLMSSPLW